MIDFIKKMSSVLIYLNPYNIINKCFYCIENNIEEINNSPNCVCKKLTVCMICMKRNFCILKSGCNCFICEKCDQISDKCKNCFFMLKTDSFCNNHICKWCGTCKKCCNMSGCTRDTNHIRFYDIILQNVKNMKNL